MKRGTRKRSMIAAFAIFAALFSIKLAWAAPPPGKGGGGDGGSNTSLSYQIIQLPTDDGFGNLLSGMARDINLSRLIVGVVDKENENGAWTEAVCWTVTNDSGAIESSMHYLDQDVFTQSQAWGCNEWGEIVGSSGLTIAAYWSDKNSSVEILPGPFVLSNAYAINNDSVVCGRAVTTSGETVAVVWTLSGGQWQYFELSPQGNPGLDNNGQPLPDKSIARDISEVDPDTGLMTIVGRSNGSAVAWTVFLSDAGNPVAGPVTILDPESDAVAVNNAGSVCGWTLFGPSGCDGIVWGDDGSATLLPRIYRGKPAAPQASFPSDVNEAGLIVGYSGFEALVWPSKDSSPVPLNEFLPKGKSTSFLDLYQANAVNALGEIVGQGSLGEGGPNPPYLAISK